MYEIIGRGKDGRVAIVDYDDYSIEILSSNEYIKSQEIGIPVKQARNLLYLGNNDLSRFSSVQDIGVLNVERLNGQACDIYLYNHNGLFKPVSTFYIQDSDGVSLASGRGFYAKQVEVSRLKSASKYSTDLLLFRFTFEPDKNCHLVMTDYRNNYETHLANVSGVNGKRYNSRKVYIFAVLDPSTFKFRILPVGDRNNRVGFNDKSRVHIELENGTYCMYNDNRFIYQFNSRF